MSRKLSLIPLREINWKKYAYLHNRQNNIYFDCECGKRYVSFPAIYLHFQRKHNRKLSTKQEPYQCQIRNEQNQTVYFYFLRMKRQTSSKFLSKNNEKLPELNTVSAYCKHFLRENKDKLKKLGKLGNIKKIFFCLEAYTNSVENREVKSQSLLLETIQNLPLYLNDFASHQIKVGFFQSNSQYSEFCYTLLFFSNWLNQKGLTNLVVEFNSEESAHNSQR